MRTQSFKASAAVAGALMLAACQTAQNPRAEAHMSQRWQGKPLQDFESRFGGATSTQVSGGQTRLVYSATREEVTPAHESGIGFGIAGVAVGGPMSSKVPAKSERKSCTIELIASHDTITRLAIIKDDSTRQAASLCLLTYGS